MIKLTVVMGPDTGNVFLQNGNSIVIGRNNDCDVVLHDGAISRRHCIIEVRGNAFVVSDLRSPNGLSLNDPKNRIESQVLRNGDELILGRSRLRVELPILTASEIKTVETEPGNGSALEIQTPALTIDDALKADSAPVALPSGWQEGMTVFTPRSKVVSGLGQSVEHPGAQLSFVKKNETLNRHKSRFFNGVVMGVKKFFSSLRPSW